MARAEKQTTDYVNCSPDVGDYIKAYWTDCVKEIERSHGVTISVKPGGQVRVQGARESVEDATADLKQFLGRVRSQHYTIGTRPDIRRVFCTLEPKLKTIGKTNECLIKPLDKLVDTTLSALPIREGVSVGDVLYQRASDSKQAAPPQVTTRHGIAITIVLGEIGKQQGDVFVCVTSPSGRLKDGLVGQSLLQHGGNRLQKYCSDWYSDGIVQEDVSDIPAGNLHCDRVYLTSLPKWDETSRDGKNVSQFIRKCLEMAEKHGKKSVVFTALGTGKYLAYPRGVVASVMYNAVMEFGRWRPRTSSVRQVQFAIHESDTKVIQAFRDVEQKYLSGGLQSSRSSGCWTGSTKIEIVVDDLETQQVDALLCSVSSDLDLSKGGMCRALLDAGGDCLQDECHERYGDSERRHGDVIRIGGGNLPCKAVFLTVLPKYGVLSTRQVISDVVKKTLQLCQDKGYKSLAIPALGTGFLRYPKGTIANTMYQAVVEWTHNNQGSALTNVRFVLQADDKECQQKFNRTELRANGRLQRLERTLVSGEANLRKDVTSKFTTLEDGYVIGQVALQVFRGDIVNENADAIVNGVGPNFEMSGAVSNALLQKWPGLEKECKSKQTTLRQEGVAITRSKGIPARHVVHVQHQTTIGDWRRAMVTCLKQAEVHGIQSLAFPMLGTGYKGCKPEQVTEALFDAVVEFEGNQISPKLQDIRLVIFESRMEGPAVHALRKRITTLNHSNSGKKGDKIGVQWDPSNDDDQSCLDVKIFSHSDDNITRCIQALNKALDQEYITTEIKEFSKTLPKLSTLQLHALIEMKFPVDVEYNRGVVKVFGPGRNVDIVKDEIRRRIRDRERRIADAQAAELLNAQLRWSYEEVTSTTTKVFPYDKMNSFYIESAYKAGKDRYKLRDTNGRGYVIDLKTMREYSEATGPADSIRVVRKNKLKATKSPGLPKDWSAMDQQKIVVTIDLPHSAKEFQDVSSRFIKQVKRIQNPTLYQQYMTQKKMVSTEKSKLPAGVPVERTLWHGTKPGVIDSVITRGFNRSFSGANANYQGSPHFGDGSYFAACASYSAQNYLTKSGGDQRERYMFQVKVVTGELCQGTPGLRFLPDSRIAPRPATCDCAVDKLTDPMEFITFHDVQAYPEYLLTYTC